MVYAKMQLLNTFFVHWRVSPTELQSRVPEGLELDLFEGDAYVSMVAIRVIGPFPWISHVYNQLNVRTYVTGNGIVLLETLVSSFLPALGARLLGLPYREAKDLDLKVNNGLVSLHAFGLDIEGDVDTGVQKGSLESFLTDRFWLYTCMPGGLVYGLRIEHAPWRLHPVKLKKPLPSSVVGISGASEPAAAHLAEGVEVSVVEFSLRK